MILLALFSIHSICEAATIRGIVKEIHSEAAAGLGASLEADKELFARYKLESLQALLAEMTQALQAGNALAELMKYGIVEN